MPINEEIIGDDDDIVVPDEDGDDDEQQFYDFGETSDKSEFTALEDVIDGDLDEEETPEDEQEEVTAPEAQTTPEVAELEGEKSEQTPEQNAYFAEMRRQREAQQRALEEKQRLEALRQQLPEVQLANMLAQEYGVTPEVMLQRLQQERIVREAQQRGITPQQVITERQQQEAAQRYQQMLVQQQQLLQVQSLVSRLEREGAEVRAKYPQLTPDDLTEAVIYGRETNTLHLPLEQLIRLKHADKLYNVDPKAVRQEALAQVSGRMTNTIKPPQGKANPTAPVLSDAEMFFAKKLGMSPAEYAKYK